MDISTVLTQPDDAEHRFAYLHGVLSCLPQAVGIFDETMRLRVWNHHFPDLLGVDANVLGAGLSPADLQRLVEEHCQFSGEDGRDQVLGLLALLPAEPAQFNVRFEGRGGHTLRVLGEPIRESGRLLGFVVTYTDISEQLASAERDQLAQKVFVHTPTGIIVTDATHRIVSSNPALTQISGFEPIDLVGRNVFSFVVDDPARIRELQEEQISVRGVWSGELEVSKKQGGTFPAGIRVSRVDDNDTGLPAHFIWIVADITERKEAEERMRHIAQHDALTGLPNRLSLLIRLAQLLPEARRHGWQIAIMFLDLDRFKVINDTLGHQVGDELLQEVARRLSNVVRETDFVARLGGDEFVVILPAINQGADAALVATKIIASLSTPVQVDANELHTSPSIGISIFPNDGPDGDTILKNADTAMYHAKAAGRNNYQFFAPDMNQAATERLDIERKLRHAINRNELTLCFQPQFNAQTGKPTGVEALVRWFHPEDGAISPVRFIPVAEETGIIVQIGEWVLANACREMRHWIDAGLQPLRMAVNVSARQLRRRDFCETVAGILAETGLAPELLELEITESSVMENPEEAIEILQRLGSMGVTLAIDDFGTGYSSLAYLKLFPIDHLKIDRSFVRDIETDLNDRAIALGTIALAHSLGLNVIAEGVETPDQLELLRANGCDEVQGFLFSKPVTGPAAFSYLHAYRDAE